MNKAHAEKLDKILYVLLDTHGKRLAKQQFDRRLTFKFIANNVAEVKDDWEVELLRQRLLGDGFMVMGKFGNGEPPEMTPTGIAHIQSGGYKANVGEREIDKVIKDETVRNFKYQKWAFYISILSMLGTIGAAVIALIALSRT